MAIKDLVPQWGRKKLPERRTEDRGLFSLQRDMNRLFDSFFDDFGLSPMWSGTGSQGFTPRVNVSETDKEVEVSAELPGIDKEDVTVEFENNTLVIQGERREEKKEDKKGWHRVECSYGQFYRAIDLPAAVDPSGVKAQFKKGVLNIRLPKLKEEKDTRKAIEITSD